MSESPSALALAARTHVATPYYGLVWLALAQLAYTDEDARVVKGVGTDLPTAVAGLPPLPAPPGQTAPPSPWGAWRVDWGPIVSDDNANLMYIASYRETGRDLPVVSAVCIRGTDTQEHWRLLGLLTQIYEDLDVSHKVAWARVMDDPSSPCVSGASAGEVAIAQGTCVGLKILRSMKSATPGASGSIDAVTCIRQLLAADPSLPIVVTGHSLGGCQATVMAAFLDDTLKAAGITARIVPHTFAAPTAGTTAFAAKFDAQLPEAHLWWNTLDVVPNAFQNDSSATTDVPSLTHIHGFWANMGGPAISDVEKVALDGFIALEHAYAQPTANVMPLNGAVVVPGASAKCKNDWPSQVLVQHLTPQYHYLISTQMADRVAAYPLPGTPDPCVQVPPAP